MALGPLASLTFGTSSSRVESRVFDRRYQPKSIDVSGSQLRWDYTVDDVGNPTAISQTQPANVSRTFGYQDFQYFLTSANGPWPGPLSWAYDRVGNRTMETRDTTTEAYCYVSNGTSNSPILDKVATSTCAGGTIRDYTFGAAGHLEDVTAGGNVVDFDFDEAGQLEFTERLAAGENALFSYDGRGFLRDGLATSVASAAAGAARTARAWTETGGTDGARPAFTARSSQAHSSGEASLSPPFPPTSLTTKVVTPLGDKSIHYFSVWPCMGAAADGTEFQEYGLPFTRGTTDAASGAFLSTETFDCTANPGDPANPTGCVKRRSTYVRYERDTAGGAQDVGDASHRNQRLSFTKTVFHDDSSVFAESSWSSFDGLGHYRSESRGGNFVPGHVRTITTNFNPGYDYSPGAGGPWTEFPPASNWILGTFDRRTSSETSVQNCASGTSTQVATEEFCFEPGLGFLSSTRSYVSSAGTIGATDIVRTFDRNTAGNVVTERWYNGDGASIQTNQTICNVNLSGDAVDYRRDHTYSGGVRASSHWSADDGTFAGALAFLYLDQTIHVASGLASSVRDTAQLQTNLEYDDLGRLTAAKPSAAAGGAWEAWEFYPYVSAASPARFVHTASPNGMTSGSLLRETTQFDGLGRTSVELRRAADGVNDERDTHYNANGWKERVTEWGRSALYDSALEYRSYDPFGRPASLRRYAGSTSGDDEVVFAYAGDRTITRSLTLGTSANAAGTHGFTDVSTTETYDHHGRLATVGEYSAGDLATLVNTNYNYDVGNRLKKSFTNPTGTTNDQTRCWDYDQRGFLLSEKHPEKGAPSVVGTVTYSLFDAMGRAGRRVDGPSALDFVFDRVGRLTDVETTGGNDWKKFIYSGANVGSTNYRKGKLSEAIGYNYPNISGTTYTLSFKETFTYGATQGALSSRKVEFFNGASALDVYSHSEAFDALGQRTSIVYPTCQVGSWACASAVPGRTITNTYVNGYLTSVGTWATIAYHPNGMWSSITHLNTPASNNVTDEQAMDASRRPRPASLLTRKGASTTLWKTGTFLYDDAGNILKMGPTEVGGSDVFIYDGVSRLKEARLKVPSGATEITSTQMFAYDINGNLTSTTTDGTTVGSPASGTRNRLTSATYDDAGNLTFLNSGTTFAYDALNRLTKRSVAGQLDYHFLYTADDERILVYVPGSGDDFRWTLRDFGGKALRELGGNGAGQLEARRDSIYRGDQLLASDVPGQSAFRLHLSLDHLGTVRMGTDSAGTNLGKRKYYPYGDEATVSGDQGPVKFKFTGHERDFFQTTGGDPTADDLDYMHARHFAPLQGRFLSVDPVPGMAPRRPQTMNRFVYALGNPLRIVDRNGATPESFLNSILAGGANLQAGGRLIASSAILKLTGTRKLAGGSAKLGVGRIEASLNAKASGNVAHGDSSVKLEARGEIEAVGKGASGSASLGVKILEAGSLSLRGEAEAQGTVGSLVGTSTGELSVKVGTPIGDVSIGANVATLVEGIGLAIAGGIEVLSAPVTAALEDLVQAADPDLAVGSEAPEQ